MYQKDISYIRQLVGAFFNAESQRRRELQVVCRFCEVVAMLAATNSFTQLVIAQAPRQSFIIHHFLHQSPCLCALCVSRPLAALRVRFAQATRRLRRGRIRGVCSRTPHLRLLCRTSHKHFSAHVYVPHIIPFCGSHELSTHGQISYNITSRGTRSKSLPRPTRHYQNHILHFLSHSTPLLLKRPPAHGNDIQNIRRFGT